MNMMGKDIPDPKEKVTQFDIPQGEIKERHMESNTFLIRKGNIADRPDGSTWTKAFWAEDENKLYIWNSSSKSWKSVTLS